MRLAAMSTNWHDRLALGQRRLAERGVRQVARLPGFRTHHDTGVEATRKRHCLLDRTSTRATRSDRAQTTLSAHIRPIDWNGNAMDMDTDALGLVVRALLRAHDAQAVRALAVTCRTCADAVRQVLLEVRTQLRATADAYAYARAEWVLVCDLHPDFLSEEGKAHHSETLRRCGDARERYEACMRDCGIRDRRLHGLLTRVGQRWFHDAKSVLGHVASGCELCAEPLAGDAFGAGPVALFACVQCAHANRVRFVLHPDEERARRLRKPLVDVPTLARFPRTDSPANNYACALLSKRETHQRRMKTDRAAVARRAVPLSRRVHRQKWTDALHATWTDYEDEDEANSDQEEIDFELWHTLPPGIPADLCFASVVQAHVGDGTRAEAEACGTVRRRARAATDRRRHQFTKLVGDYGHVVKMVDLITRSRPGYLGWIQVLDLVSAARAFDLRWMFRAQLSRFGDWRTARYALLDVPTHTLCRNASRVENVASVLKATLSGEGLSLLTNGPTRACVLNIVKHLPQEFLDAPWKVLHSVVSHLRRAPITLWVSETGSRLYVDIRVDPLIVRRPKLTLEIVLTEYVLKQLHQLVGAIDCDCLTSETRNAIERMANQVSAQCWERHAARPSLEGAKLCPGRDLVRGLLFRLPGAWPLACIWFRDADARPSA